MFSLVFVSLCLLGVLVCVIDFVTVAVCVGVCV